MKDARRVPWQAGPWAALGGREGGGVLSTASGMVARDIKLKLGYQKYIIDCDNELLHEIYEDVTQSKEGDWSRTE